MYNYMRSLLGVGLGDLDLDAVAKYKLNSIPKPLQNVHSHSRSAAPAAAVHAAARHQRPLRPLPMAETGLWGPCALPTHARSTAASTVDAEISAGVGACKDLKFVKT